MVNDLALAGKSTEIRAKSRQGETRRDVSRPSEQTRDRLECMLPPNRNRCA